MIMFKYNTKATNAHPNSKSLRSTIPKEIVELLDLHHGDTVQWNVDVISNDEFKIIVKKKKDVP
jgi:antitoxin component of MazEF toxin-antitoxin module